MFAGPPLGEATDDRDSVAAGEGDDAILAFNRPAARDVIACGSGFDRVLVDGKDQIAGDCERKFTRPGEFFRSISNYNYFEPLDRL